MNQKKTYHCCASSSSPQALIAGSEARNRREQSSNLCDSSEQQQSVVQCKEYPETLKEDLSSESVHSNHVPEHNFVFDSPTQMLPEPRLVVVLLKLN